MSWFASSPISLGASNTGLAATLKFAMAIGATIDPELRDLTYETSGATLTEDGSGLYAWSFTGMPTGFGGAGGRVVFYTGTLGEASNFSGVTIKGVVAFGPVDEYAADGLFPSGGSSGLSGTAQAGSATTITLQSNASATDGTYVGQSITINPDDSGQQVRVIMGYVGSSRVATITPAWAINPANGTAYVLPGMNPTTTISVTNQNNPPVVNNPQ